MQFTGILDSLLSTDQLILFGEKPLNNDQRIIYVMGKKMEGAETKKECPSCGLGVAVESTICEFCGWDFDEEDEWILQIEKLERDLMVEKQKFEPGTVNHMIESTLRNTVIERVDAPIPPAPEDDPEPAHESAFDTLITIDPEEDEPFEAPAPRQERKLAPPPAPPAAASEAPKVRRTRSVTPKPAPAVEKVSFDEVEVDEPTLPPVRPRVHSEAAPAVRKEASPPVRRTRTVSSARESRPTRQVPPKKPPATPTKAKAEFSLSKATSGLMGMFSMKEEAKPAKKVPPKPEVPEKKAKPKTTATTTRTRVVRKVK
jgi:hypothetical protein